MAPRPAQKILITGPAGSGKTHAVLEEVLAAMGEGRAETTLCLLPTYGQVEHMKRRFVSFSGRGALFDPPFLTFTGLYEWLLPGKRIRHLASRMARRRLMERAIEEADVQAFRRVAETPGFRDAALKVVKEIRENGLSGGEVRGAVESQFDADDPAADRVRGFLEIALAYEGQMRRAGVRDHEGALLETLNALDEGSGRDPSLVALDGFANFTRLEFRILEALSRRAGRIIVTLPRDRERAANLFRISSETHDAILGLGFQKRPLGRDRRAGTKALQHVSLRLFGEPVERIAAEGRVREIVGADRPSEVEEIAREIDRIRRGDDPAAASDPPALREIGVIVRKLETYRDLIPHEFERHGIPVRLVQDPLPLRSEPIIRHALAFLGAVAGRKSFDDVGFMRYLLSAHVGARGGLLSLEERYRLRRAADRIADGVRRRGPPATLDDLLRMGPKEAALDRVAASLREVRTTLEGSLPPAEMSSRIEEAIAVGITPAFEVREGDAGDDRTFWHERFRRESAALEALRRSVRDAGAPALRGEGAEVSATRFVKDLTESVLDETATIRDRRLNCVNVIDAREARHWDSLRVVFVAGLLEKEFPIYPREDIFIRDTERRRLNEGTELSLRENLRQRDEERYLFYVAATRARDLLYLCHPAHGPDGKEAQGSFYLSDLRRLFGEGEIRLRRPALAEPCPPPEEASLPEDLEMEVARSLDPGELPSPLALALYQTAPDRGLFRSGEGFSRTGGAPLREADLRDRILERTALASPSSVNQFLQCPRLHFIGRVLGVREPDPGFGDRLGPMEVGEIAHAVLERHHREGAPAGALEDRIAEVIEEALEGLDLGVRREIAEARLRRRVLWTLEREGADTGPFRPAELEMGFGEEEGITLPCEGGPVTLRGKIDRIDRAVIDGKEYCLPVDYKLTHGFRKQEREALLAQEDVQILFYGAVARRLLGAAVAGVELFPLGSRTRGGVYLEGMRDRVAGRVESEKQTIFVPEEELEEMFEGCESKVVEVIGRARSGEVARDPADPSGCTPGGCWAYLVCRPDRAALRRAGRAGGGETG